MFSDSDENNTRRENCKYL